MARRRRGGGAQGRGVTAAPAPSRPPPGAPEGESGSPADAPRPGLTAPLGARWSSPGWRWPLGVSAGSAVVAFAVYVRTLAPSIPTGDSGELVAVAYLLGIAHPPGYPLFSIIGHLFTLLPFGSPAWRVNLVSAVFHAAAAGVTAWSIYRLLAEERTAAISPAPPRHGGGEGRALRREETGAERLPWGPLIGAAVGGLALAFSAAVWSYAVVAEVFAINSFFAALILFILLEWERRPERFRLLWAFGLASGLAATNHHTIVFIAPACLVLLVSGGRKLLNGEPAPVSPPRSAAGHALSSRALRELSVAQPRMAPFDLARHGATAAGLVLVGLLPYMYLPLAASADPALNWGDPRSVDGVVRHLTRQDYGTFRLTVSDTGAMGSPLGHVGLLMHNLYDGFTPLGGVLAAVGAWWLATRRRVAGIAIGTAFLFTGPVFVAYANPFIDHPLLLGVLERFYILPSVFFALAVGAGAYQVMAWVVALAPIAEPRRAAAAVGLLLLLVPLSALVVHFTRIDQSQNMTDHHFGEDLLAPLEHGALFITQGDVVTMVVDYFQHVEGVRRDITALDIEKLKLATYARQMRRQHPEVVIPFEAYVVGTDHMARLVEANWGSRPVYLLGTPKDPGFYDGFDTQRAGFATRLLPKGSAPNGYGIVEKQVDLYRRAHYPTRSFPETVFESGIVAQYGQVAFDLAYVLDDGVRDAEAIDYYRLAIQFTPKTPASYKNLGLLLLKQGAGPDAVGPLWEEFLKLAPDDDQAPAIRERLRLMGRPQ